MASRGVSGLDIELSKVPTREEGMNPFEIMLSESQERMIVVVEKGKKEEINENYDYMIRNNTVLLPGDDAAILRIKGTKKAIALTTDGNGRYCYLDPLTGGKIAVAEAARNLSCKGALPRAVTDCLNFGNPEKETIYWQLEEAIKGISEACRVLQTPVISGNVSLYNESKGESIYPTPVIGMVGIIEDYNHICSMEFKNHHDLIVLLGENKEELGGSEYLKVIHNLEKGIPPRIDLLKEQAVQNVCREAIKKELVSSAHDCSEGGLAIALSESCIKGRKGAEIEIEGKIRSDALLFGESQSRIMLSLNPKNLTLLKEIADIYQVPLLVLGSVEGDKLKINRLINIKVEQLEKAWRGAK